MREEPDSQEATNGVRIIWGFNCRILMSVMAGPGCCPEDPLQVHVAGNGNILVFLVFLFSTPTTNWYQYMTKPELVFKLERGCRLWAWQKTQSSSFQMFIEWVSCQEMQKKYLWQIGITNSNASSKEMVGAELRVSIENPLRRKIHGNIKHCKNLLPSMTGDQDCDTFLKGKIQTNMRPKRGGGQSQRT